MHSEDYDMAFNAPNHQSSSSPQTPSFPFPTSATTPSFNTDTGIENLTLVDCLRNPHVENMFNKLNDANEKLVQNAESQQRLYEQINELTADMHALKVELYEVKSKIQRRKLSITSNDSSSEVVGTKVIPSIFGNDDNGLNRPNGYPKSILWNLRDCQSYPGLVTGSNQSRPAMEKCVRNKRGVVISSGAYDGVRKTARILVNIHLAPLATPSDPAARAKSKTKTYYQKYYPQNYQSVVDKLEEKEPLLALCSAQWKADHIIGNCLQATVDAEKAANTKLKRGSTALAEAVDAWGSNGDARSQGTTSSKRPRTGDENEDPNLGQRTKKNKTNRADTSKNGPPSALSALPKGPLNVQLSNLGSAANTEIQNGDDGDKIQQENSLQNNTALPNAPASSLTTLKAVDVSFIYVDTEYSSLKDDFAHNFPNIENYSNLLYAMEDCPEFKSAPPSKEVLEFLSRIDDADPNSSELSEDDSNASWGHHQFTAGSLSCTTVLTDWVAIGNCEVACKLIAAALKTCKVARQICFERGIAALSYLSDIYLQNIVTLIWELWRAADGPIFKGKGKALASESTPESTNNSRGPVNPATLDEVPAQAVDEAELSTLLNILIKDDLKQFVKAYSITLPSTNKQRTKPDLISAILKDPAASTKLAVLEIRKLVSVHESRKTTKRATTRPASKT